VRRWSPQRIALDTAYVAYLSGDVLISFAGIGTPAPYDVAATRFTSALPETVEDSPIFSSSSLATDPFKFYLDGLQRVKVGISPGKARELATRISVRITHGADLSDHSIGVLALALSALADRAGVAEVDKAADALTPRMRSEKASLATFPLKIQKATLSCKRASSRKFHPGWRCSR